MNIKNKYRNRSASRLALIQIIFNSLVIQKDIDEIIENYNSSFLQDLNKNFEIDEIDEQYFDTLIQIIKFRYDEIINLIKVNLNSNWSFERLGKIDKSILIVGISELKINNSTPLISIISEYIEFATQLGADHKFVNKILDIASKTEIDT